MTTGKRRLLPNILFDREKFAYFYFIKMLYVDIVLTCLYRPAFSFIDNYIFTGIMIIWLICILISDIFQRKIIMSRYQLLLLIFCLISLISFVVNFRAFGIVNIKTFALLFAMCFVLYPLKWYLSEQRMKEFLKRISKNIIIVIGCFNMVSIILYIMIRLNISLPFDLSKDMLLVGGHVTSTRNQFIGIYTSSILGAVYSNVAILLTLYMVDNKMIHTFPAAFSIVTSIIFVYLSYSRNSYITLGIIAVCLCYRYLCNKTNEAMAKRTVILGLLVIIVTVLILIFPKLIVLFHNYNDNYFTFFNKLSSDRLMLSSVIISGMRTHLWLGYGWGDYGIIAAYDKVLEHPHNSVLAALLYSGIIAMIIYIYFVAVSFANFCKNRKKINENGNYWLKVMAICIFINSLFDIAIFGDIHYHIETGLFWLLMGYLVQDISFSDFVYSIRHREKC